MTQCDGWTLETIGDFPGRGLFRSALFDFDGTLSLIRQGWQEVMKPYFFDVLRAAPGAGSDEQTWACVHEFVDTLTGKQTIYQCIALQDEVQKRGGTALDPQAYKDEYSCRLLERISHRVKGLESGELDPRDLVVPGSFELLTALRDRGLTLYLASGTDEPYVLQEAALLGVTEYFNGGIYGAQKDYKLFSKAMVVDKILTTHSLHGGQLVGFGDGYVEIENVKAAQGCAVGVASDELNRRGVDAWKRERLIRAGADIIIPDYGDTAALLNYLFAEE